MTSILSLHLSLPKPSPHMLTPTCISCLKTATATIKLQGVWREKKHNSEECLPTAGNNLDRVNKLTMHFCSKHNLFISSRCICLQSLIRWQCFSLKNLTYVQTNRVSSRTKPSTLFWTKSTAQHLFDWKISIVRRPLPTLIVIKSHPSVALLLGWTLLAVRMFALVSVAWTAFMSVAWALMSVACALVTVTTVLLFVYLLLLVRWNYMETKVNTCAKHCSEELLDQSMGHQHTADQRQLASTQLTRGSWPAHSWPEAVGQHTADQGHLANTQLTRGTWPTCSWPMLTLICNQLIIGV